MMTFFTGATVAFKELLGAGVAPFLVLEFSKTG